MKTRTHEAEKQALAKFGWYDRAEALWETASQVAVLLSTLGGNRRLVFVGPRGGVSTAITLEADTAKALKAAL